ncbi:Stk1 family PASTA domain-containing Ser/Thr kinase [Alpinimonas psychrophila]|uniref:non-specific serine/threonine protein kinase n=1 Tax=Alpinimonas psychrophila TaxID=748908 RepID=A0A7W3PPD4_9MICO|nr:Stk1 family PASTA domain-containing Ser/Thr kinase [Alpinimonas psychrophila]MBA8829350.1 serine/threonine-protein kinase [Alpinimonas psychrophila]
MTNENRTVANRYELGKLLGSGGMGEVFVATDLTLGRRVAVKLLRPEFVKDTKLCTRFKQEARSASKMSHPNIVRVFDAGDDLETLEDGHTQKRPFIVMEYVEGVELSTIIARGPLKVSEATRVAVELLAAIGYAHEMGVVHRDVKPSNIMLTRSGQTKVLDFGIARAITDAFSDLTQTTTILGTAAYFSPEQARGESVDARTDIYALGVVLFEMLTGAAPFSGETAVIVAHRHIHELPEAPSTLNARVSPAMDHVVLKALAKDKNNRYPSAAAFARELALAVAGHIPTPEVVLDDVDQLLGPAAAAGRPVAAKPVLPSDFNTLFGSGLDTAPKFEISKRRRPQRSRVIVGLLTTVLAIIAIVGMSVWVVNIAPTDFFPSASRTVPDIRDMNFFEASAALDKVNLVATEASETSSTVAKGVVVRSEPGRGAIVDSGITVVVYVSEGLAKVVVPATVGMAAADATKTIVAAKLKQGSLTPQNSPTVAENLVIGTTPAQGTQVEEGSLVTLLVSNGHIELPSLGGLALKAATDILRGPTLLLSPTVTADPSCPKRAELVVNRQSVPAGQVPQGTAITLTYCSG